MHAPRFNKGKVDYTLIPQDALEAEAKVWTSSLIENGGKYERNSWTSLWGTDTLDVCLASALRHIAEMRKGHMMDDESGLYHAAHVRCNMGMIIRYLEELK